MFGKRKALFSAILAAIVAVLAFGLGSGAATSADGTGVTFGHSTSSTVSNPDGSKDVDVTTVQPGTVDLTGKVSQVAVGTTTKFRVQDGIGVWNLKIWWDDSPGGSAYKVYNKTVWNPCTRYSRLRLDVINNDGNMGDWALFNCETITFTRDTTGTATTKANSDYAIQSGVTVNPSGCVYLIPGGGSETSTDCAV